MHPIQVFHRLRQRTSEGFACMEKFDLPVPAIRSVQTRNPLQGNRCPTNRNQDTQSGNASFIFFIPPSSVFIYCTTIAPVLPLKNVHDLVDTDGVISRFQPLAIGPIGKLRLHIGCYMDLKPRFSILSLNFHPNLPSGRHNTAPDVGQFRYGIRRNLNALISS